MRAAGITWQQTISKPWQHHEHEHAGSFWGHGHALSSRCSSCARRACTCTFRRSHRRGAVAAFSAEPHGYGAGRPCSVRACRYMPVKKQMCVRACVCVCVRACLCACVRACVHASVRPCARAPVRPCVRASVVRVQLVAHWSHPILHGRSRSRSL